MLFLFLFYFSFFLQHYSLTRIRKPTLSCPSLTFRMRIVENKLSFTVFTAISQINLHIKWCNVTQLYEDFVPESDYFFLFCSYQLMFGSCVCIVRQFVAFFYCVFIVYLLWFLFYFIRCFYHVFTTGNSSLETEFHWWETAWS